MNEQLALEIDDLACIRTAWQRAEWSAGAFIASYSSPHTRRGYASDLRQFFGFLRTFTPDIDPIHEVTRGHLDTFARWMEEKGCTPSTVGRRLSVASSWYQYLLVDEVIAKNPAQFVKRPKVSRESTREWLTRTEMQQQLELAEHAAGADPRRAYDYALLCLLATNALRIGEVCGADVEDLGRHRYHHTLAIVGKGNQPTVVPIPPRTAEAIYAALDGRETGPLILNRYRNRMNRETAGRICDRWARAAGVSRRITPHSWRHSSITAVVKASNGNAELARQHARHADLSTTQRYVRGAVRMDGAGAYLVSNYIAGGD